MLLITCKNRHPGCNHTANNLCQVSYHGRFSEVGQPKTADLRIDVVQDRSNRLNSFQSVEVVVVWLNQGHNPTVDQRPKSTQKFF